MDDEKKKFDLSYLIATFFAVGRLPRMPGTFGTMAGLGVYLLLYHIFPSRIVLGLITTAVYFAGVYVSHQVQKKMQEKDPSCVVIDEVAGIFITLLFIKELTLFNILLAFCLFRIFDIFKIFPVNKCEDLPGGWGVMTDDVAAGIYSGIIISLIIWFL